MGNLHPKLIITIDESVQILSMELPYNLMFTFRLVEFQHLKQLFMQLQM